MTFLFVLVAAYLLVTGYLGYCGWRGTKTPADYLTAGGQIHPVVMALSYGATFISTSAIVGFGGAAAMFGMSLHWLTFFNIFFGIFIAFVFFGTRTRTLGRHLQAHSFPELIGKRFASRALQIFGGGVILLFMPIYTAAVLIGAANVLVAGFDINYDAALLLLSLVVGLYVIMGGLKGVMYTDALQGAIMFFGLLLVLVLTYAQLGGITAAHEKLTALAPLAIEKWGALGHRGWTAMPEWGSRFWWVVMSQIAFGVGVGVIAQPQLVVRFMTVKNNRELHRAAAIGAAFILVTVGVAYCVGPLSNWFFLNMPSRVTGETFGQLAVAAADNRIDMVIPLFMRHFMPPWLSDVFFVTLLAAAMSTISSQFHTMGVAASRDVFAPLFPPRHNDDRRAVVAARAGALFVFVWSVLIAEALPRYWAGEGVAIIARGTAVFFGLCAATFLPLFVGGLYSRRLTRAGAVWGGVAGFVASFVWLFFVKQKESADLRLCEALTGKICLAPDLQKWLPDWVVVAEVDPTVVALPVALVVTVVVSALTRPLPAAHLDNCFRRS
ncbi:MAG: sodium:solute symporter family protein [Planctomycetota bacterium]|jgi:SSS family solute:Na+ symporter|nr:sodium:solute symporter family protein [Planctomycetota bacterium]